MKNSTIILTACGVALGYFANTERGKRIRTWATDGLKKQVNNLFNKIDEVTTGDHKPDDKKEGE